MGSFDLGGYSLNVGSDGVAFSKSGGMVQTPGAEAGVAQNVNPFSQLALINPSTMQGDAIGLNYVGGHAVPGVLNALKDAYSADQGYYQPAPPPGQVQARDFSAQTNVSGSSETGVLIIAGVLGVGLALLIGSKVSKAARARAA